MVKFFATDCSTSSVGLSLCLELVAPESSGLFWLHNKNFSSKIPDLIIDNWCLSRKTRPLAWLIARERPQEFSSQTLITGVTVVCDDVAIPTESKNGDLGTFEHTYDCKAHSIRGDETRFQFDNNDPPDTCNKCGCKALAEGNIRRRETNDIVMKGS